MKLLWLDREVTIEVVVGAFIIMIMLGLGYFTIILSREAWFGNKETVEVVFKNVMGLREGDSVVMRGMTVGKVKDMNLQKEGAGVKVKITLDPGKKPVFKKDYKVTIVSTSILGGRYLQIHEGSEKAEILEDWSNLKGDEPYDLIADAAEIMNAARKSVVEGKLVDNFREASEQIKQIAIRINAGEGTVGKLLSKDDVLYRDMAATVASFKNVAQGVEKGDGLVGKLLKDDSLYKDAKDIVNQIKSAIDDMRETTPVVTFTSVFFGAF